MGRPAGVHWDRAKRAWRTNVGGETAYFRGIPKSDRLAAEVAFAKHVEGLKAHAYNPHDPTVEQVCDAYAEDCRARLLKPRTLRGTAEMLAAWCDWPGPADPRRHGARRARTIAAEDLGAMELAWRRAGRKPHYRARLVRTVKACWRWAHQAGLVPANPLLKVRGVVVPRAPERYAERAEVAAFLRFAWRRMSALGPERRRIGRLLCLLVRVAAHTGARPKELCEATWADFRPERRALALEPDRHKTGDRTGKGRTIFLPPALVRALLRERGRPDRHPTHPFWHRRGEGKGRAARRDAFGPWDPRRLTRRVREWRRRAAAAGLPVRDEGDNRFVLYRLRHTWASDALMAGVSPVEAATVLGTSARMIESTYGHVLEQHARQVADQVAHARRRRPQPPVR